MNANMSRILTEFLKQNMHVQVDEVLLPDLMTLKAQENDAQVRLMRVRK